MKHDRLHDDPGSRPRELVIHTHTGVKFATTLPIHARHELWERARINTKRKESDVFSPVLSRSLHHHYHHLRCVPPSPSPPPAFQWQNLLRWTGKKFRFPTKFPTQIRAALNALTSAAQTNQRDTQRARDRIQQGVRFFRFLRNTQSFFFADRSRTHHHHSPCTRTQ